MISQGGVYPGFYGYRAIALALPAFWPIAPWLFLPGISSLGACVYRRVARNRLNLLVCDSRCAVQPSPETESTGGSYKITPGMTLLGAVAAAKGLMFASEPGAVETIRTNKYRQKVSTAANLDAIKRGYNTRNDASRGLGFSLLISGIVVFSLICWFYYVEFYPFTSWHLYSDTDNSGKVAYLKVFAQYDSVTDLSERALKILSARWPMMAAIGRQFKSASARPATLRPGLAQRHGDLAICKKFLIAAASVYNKKAPPNGKITQYRIERWIGILFRILRTHTMAISWTVLSLISEIRAHEVAKKA